MSASTSDPQSPARLPSLNEALDIAITTDPLEVTISVLYPSGAWDVVYQDGGFAQAYRTSTRSGSDFHLRRAGGWPPGVRFEPKVKEAPAPPSGGQALGAIYEIDFRTLPTQVIGAAGSYAIDGLTWWAKGALSGLPFGLTMGSGILNGSGLYLSTAPGIGMVDNQDPYPYRLLCLPLANVTGYNPLAPLIVRAKFAMPSYDNGRSMQIGLIDAPADASNYATRTREIWTGTPTAVSGAPPNSGNVLITRGNAGETNQNSTSGITVFDQRLFGVARLTTKFANHVDQAWNGVGAIPGVDDALPQLSLPDFQTNVIASPCVAFRVLGGGDTFYITHLSISQPKS